MCKQFKILLNNMTDHLHGLCKNCIPNSSQIHTASRNQDECSRCKEGEPTIIIQQQGLTMAVCTKCYLKQQSSPPKKSTLSHNRHSSNLTKIQYFYLQNKVQIMSKSGFFSSEGKMLKKIQKYFSRWPNIDEGVKQLSKRSIISPPFTWEKIINKCDKSNSIVFLLIGSKTIFGWYHQENCKITEKGFEDNQSGFFMSNRQNTQFQYYKATQESIVTYNPFTKSISLGRPQCCEIIFEGGDSKVKCDLILPGTQWLYQFVLKV